MSQIRVHVISRIHQVLAPAIAISLVFVCGTGAAAPALACPMSIQENSVRLLDTAPGWTPFVGSPLYLHGAAPMNGPPDQLGILSDFTQQHGKSDVTYTYQLDGKFPNGKWLSCTYGESDQISLSKQLDDSVQACTFTYRKGRHAGQYDIAIRCR